ncbi:MAG: GH1 family beta-glucosidase [Oscillospiraceae bacterium]|nr:GH1 family beta-glucosidase [Oscillospiraceae bacterium]
MGFRKDFVWGGATASYQIEGAAYDDGRGLSVWDMFCKQEGRIKDGWNGDVACDHYNLYQTDVDLMKEIGYKAYRFSIAWPRILPEGTGAVNEKGLDFYDRLVDSLLEANITPYVTLFHWDYPYELFRKGGWMNPDSPKWFADYADIVARRLGDRVKNIFTHNEPQCFIGMGYQDTEHAPGIRFPIWDTLLMAHNVLLGHGYAIQALRAAIPDAKLGIAPTCSAHYPDTDSPEDIEAARKAIFDIEPDRPFWSVSLWSDPVFKAEYPKKLWDLFGQHMPKIGADDMKIISQPLDIYGQNIYNGQAIRSDGKGGYDFVQRPWGNPITAAKWPITPKALRWGPKFMFDRYGKPIYLTENGLSCQDAVSLDGKVHDPNRIDFLHRYLKELRNAADDGVDILGYFHWCVTDNFEWAKGATERFGMIYCDFETQERILKDSAYWYRDVIRANGENL